METITLQYDANNTQVQSILAMLRSIGLFKVSESTPSEEMTEEQEKEAFLYTSRVNASKIFSQYL